MTDYLNFKQGRDVEKNPGPTQNNTDSHEIVLFTELLNKFRTGTQTEADIQCIQSRSISSSDFNYGIHIMLSILGRK